MSSNDFDMNGMDRLREIRDLLQELVDRTPTQAQRYYENPTVTAVPKHNHAWRTMWADSGGTHQQCDACGAERTT